ncbi:MAG: LysR substrate-binding domain-containing protein [Polyangiaceae bacterium]
MFRGHPLTRGRVTLERFASASHALVSPGGQPSGIVDDVLKQLGVPRRVAFTTPSFLVAPQVVAMTDLVMMLPARIAAALEAQLRLATFEPPLEIPGFRMAMFWHDRHDSDPAHAFIRREIAQVAAAPADAGESHASPDAKAARGRATLTACARRLTVRRGTDRTLEQA